MADAPPGVRFTFLDYVGLALILPGGEELLRRPKEGWPIWIPGLVLGCVALSLRDRSPQLTEWFLAWFRAPKKLAVALTENAGLKKQLAELTETFGTAKASKLVIHRAVYAAGLPTEVSVADKLQNIVRDGIAITVDATLGGLLPNDPASGIRKRLDVEYSYGSDTRFPVSRTERPAGEIMRLVLPEDTEIKRLEGEVANRQRSTSVSAGTMREPDSSWIRFITAYPEIAGPPAPGRDPAKKPQKVRCEFLNATEFSYKVKVINWESRGLPADLWRGCLQIRLANSWYPEWNGVEELHVPPGEYFRLWVFPKGTISDEQFIAIINSKNLGFVHLFINGKEVAVLVE